MEMFKYLTPEEKYMQNGYTLLLARLFCNLEVAACINVEEEMEERKDERRANKKIINQQMERLNDIIKINHKKLNYWFHLDNPDGFAFPDEIWSLIKSYNPTPPKLIKNLKYIDSDGNIQKVMKIKDWKTIAEDDRWDEMGAWYLFNVGTHFYKMWDIIINCVDKYGDDEELQRLEEANNCSIDDIRDYCKYKKYMRNNGNVNSPNARFYTNIEGRGQYFAYSSHYWFIYVSFKTKRYVNMRFVKILEGNVVSDYTISKKVKKDRFSNEFDKMTLTAKDRRKLCGGEDIFYQNEINIQECMPVEIIKNVAPNSKTMKAFEKIENKTTKRYFNWRLA